MLRLLPLLLDCRALWAGALEFLLPATPLLRRSLLFALRRRGRSLHCLLLIVLPHYGVARLVTVILAAKHLLLLHSRISVS